MFGSALRVPVPMTAHLSILNPPSTLDTIACCKGDGMKGTYFLDVLWLEGALEFYEGLNCWLGGTQCTQMGKEWRRMVARNGSDY